MNPEPLDAETKQPGVTIYFNPFAFTIEKNNEMIAKGYEVMPLHIPKEDR